MKTTHNLSELEWRVAGFWPHAWRFEPAAQVMSTTKHGETPAVPPEPAVPPLPPDPSSAPVPPVPPFPGSFPLSLQPKISAPPSSAIQTVFVHFMCLSP